jgi:hypothetical protein
VDIITKPGELDENMLRTIWNTIIQNWASWGVYAALSHWMCRPSIPSFVCHHFFGPRVRDTLDEGPNLRRVNEIKQSICMPNKK